MIHRKNILMEKILMKKKKKNKLNIRNLKKLEFFKLGARKFPSPKCKKSTINFSGAWEVLS